ncbi:hypothetical protein BGZ65_007521, partial [Modicella reniformis]
MTNGASIYLNGGHHGEDNNSATLDGGGGKMPSLAGLTLGEGNVRYQQQQQRQLPQPQPQPQQDYIDPSYGGQPSYQQNKTIGAGGATTAAAATVAAQSRSNNMVESRIMSDYAFANPRTHVNGTTNGNNPPTSNHINGKSAVLIPAVRRTEMLAGAGPLLEGSDRPLAADQVFARLVKQYPTNPHEKDKRERVYRWSDDVASALTFSPDTNLPGWVIPVEPDEFDHTESPFYLDRITYELGLMAPIAKPFKRAIDVNCGSGEWALDLAMKYPQTTVYALDPTLNMARLPPRVPENCRFKIRDVKDQDGEFDLVHQRLGGFRTPILEWTPHFAELGRLTRPGGWIQLAECNGVIVRTGVESLKMNRWVESASLSSGLNPMQMVEALMPTILGAGLINVECYEYGIPLGEWAGRRGNIAMRTYLAMVESLRDEIIRMNRLEEGVFEKTIELIKLECVVEKAELVMKVICAQKPPFTDEM